LATELAELDRFRTPAEAMKRLSVSRTTGYDSPSEADPRRGSRDRSRPMHERQSDVESVFADATILAVLDETAKQLLAGVVPVAARGRQ